LPDNNNNGFRNPIAALALLLVIGVIALIASAVFGIDRGVLANMANREYARGLITFLFAVVTIGTALVLVVSALVGSSSEREEKRFQQGKEVLSLLLGVFGTIIGYYFGSTFQAAHNPSLRVSALELFPGTAKPGDTVIARALVVGGVPPYRYSISIKNEKPAVNGTLSESGEINEEIRIPGSFAQPALKVQLFIVDATAEHVTAIASVRIH